MPKDEKITNKSMNTDVTNNSGNNQENKKSNNLNHKQAEKDKSLKNQAREIHPQTPSIEKNIQQHESRDNM